MNLETVTGMVLSAMPIGEYDKRLVVLTRERGRISAFAKGARRSNSPLMAASQPFSFGQFTLYVGKSSYTVNQAEIQNYFQDLRENLEWIAYGSYFCELAAALTYENIEASGILKLLYQSLRALTVERIPNRLVRAIFELKAIAFNGEMPQMFSCAKCNRKQEDLRQVFYGRFSPKAGGMLCKECQNHGPDGMVLSETAVYTLQYIVSSKVEKLFTFVLEAAVEQEVVEAVERYLACYVQEEFHSLEMLQLFC